MKSQRLSLLVTAAALLFSCPIGAAGGPPPFIGPLRIRDLSPISMLRLDLVPAHARPGDEKISVIHVDYAEANIFIVSERTVDYLKARRSSLPLGRKDYDALMAGPGDFFIFDAELVYANFEYVRSLSPRTQVRIEWPLISQGGGFLDRTIESFHSETGLRAMS
jgi:hypothetical protein